MEASQWAPRPTPLPLIVLSCPVPHPGLAVTSATVVIYGQVRGQGRQKGFNTVYGRGGRMGWSNGGLTSRALEVSTVAALI